jgi:DNA repair protein RadD
VEFDRLLSRADEETLQTMLGRSSVRLITLLDPSSANPTRLRELLLSLHTREELLASKKSRALLFDLLRPREAELLAKTLGIRTPGDVYEALKGANIRAGSESGRLLYNFFELQVPEGEGREERPSMERCAAQYPLFEHQRRAAREIKEQLSQDPRRVLLHMPTGSGKTRTAMHIIVDHLRAREPTGVMWLAYGEELCEQAATEFLQAWRQLGDRDVPVHRFWGAHDLNPDEVHDGLVVAGLAKTFRAAKQSIQFIAKLGRRCSLVVIDEAHQAVAETYKLVLDALVLPYRETALLGLTATPGRTWSDINADEELAEFFARRKVSLHVPGYASPVDYLVAEGYLARTTYRSLLHQAGLRLSDADLKYIREGLELPDRILNKLAEDEQRNLRIVLEIEDLLKRHSRILVFAISVEHARLLSSVLRVRGHAADYVTGSTSPAERERLIRDFRSDSPEPRVLCNYGVLTTGFDAPRTSAAVIARPTKSLVLYSQMAGRAIRGVRAGGNERAEIVTVADTDLPGFGELVEAFNNWEDVWRRQQ